MEQIEPYIMICKVCKEAQFNNGVLSLLNLMIISYLLSRMTQTSLVRFSRIL